MLIHRILRISGTAALGLLCSCDGRSPFPETTPEDFEATPRADQNLELLALNASGTLVAPQQVYDRVVRDVTAIRASHLEVDGIRYNPPDTGNELLVGFDAATYAAIQERTYHDWDELNARWRVVVHPWLLRPVVDLQFGGIYRMEALAQEYAALRGVIYVDRDFITDGPTICLTLDGRNWYRYVFDRAGGDCPAGCATHHEFGFSTNRLGAIRFEGEWDSTTSRSRPDFIRRFGHGAGTSCRFWPSA